METVLYVGLNFFSWKYLLRSPLGFRRVPGWRLGCGGGGDEMAIANQKPPTGMTICGISGTSGVAREMIRIVFIC